MALLCAARVPTKGLHTSPVGSNNEGATFIEASATTSGPMHVGFKDFPKPVSVEILDLQVFGHVWALIWIDDG